MGALPHHPRVVVVGTSSVGKSTFARALAGRAGLPYIELDELHWSADWREKSPDDFARLVDSATRSQTWVVDGNYAVVREILWPRANVVVWLNYGFARTFWRGLRRSVVRMLRGTELWHGNRESFRMTFLSKKSILLWILTTHRRRRRDYPVLRASNRYPHLTWVEFRRPAEAQRWLNQLVGP